MSDSEIKNLFKRADAQVHIDEKRKQMAYQIVLMEIENQGIEKQRIESGRIEKQEIRQQEIDIRGVESRNTEKQEQLRMSVKNILLQQFQYMDKLFFYIYGGLICLGIIFIAVLQYTGVSQNEIITVCMAGAGILSITSIGVIDKMFFGKMAELGASCYFNTKQCVAAWMVMSGMINVVVLFFLACWIIAGGALYSDTLSVVGDDCPGYFVNGDRKKAFISICHQWLFDVHWLWCHRGYSGHYVYGS